MWFCMVEWFYSSSLVPDASHLREMGSNKWPPLFSVICPYLPFLSVMSLFIFSSRHVSWSMLFLVQQFTIFILCLQQEM